MRKVFSIMLSLFMFNTIQAGVIKESKSSVNFSGFGKYITENSIKIQGLRMMDDSQKEFKGEGFVGGLTAKFILKPGHDANLTALDEMKMYSIDHTKNEYRVHPIRKLEYEQHDAENYDETESTADESEPEESNIRVIRNEFKVNATGEKKSINNFPCQKYVANWIFEWENTETGERGTDSLETIIWTTTLTSEMQMAQQEELEFHKEYMDKIGFETDEFYDEILGTRWMELFSQLNQSRTDHANVNKPDFVHELQKIEGYPVVTDGSYFFTRPNQNGITNSEESSEEEATVEKPRDVKGIFGGIMKKAMKSRKKSTEKKPAGPKAAFSFYTELIKLESKELKPMDLTVPPDYTEVSGEINE